MYSYGLVVIVPCFTFLSPINKQATNIQTIFPLISSSGHKIVRSIKEKKKKKAAIKSIFTQKCFYCGVWVYGTICLRLAEAKRDKNCGGAATIHYKLQTKLISVSPAGEMLEQRNSLHSCRKQGRSILQSMQQSEHNMPISSTDATLI